MVDPESVLGAEITVSKCDICGEPCLRPEDLAVHAERHRNVVAPEKVEVVKCPKGCGRKVPVDGPDRVAHEALCDGSPPLKAKGKNRMAYRWWCPVHQFGTNGPKPWGVHKKEHHKGEDPVKADAVAPEVAGTPFGRAVELLRGEKIRLETDKVRLEKEVARIDTAIVMLNKMCETGASE